MKTLIVNRSERLDVYLSTELDITRNQAQKIVANNLLVNDVQVKKNGYKLSANDVISYEEKNELESTIKPSEIKYDTVYEDDSIIIVNKPRGLVVHPAIGHHDDTLVNALAYKYDFSEEMNEDNDVLRPGIVHRIDKDTSGLLVVAKTLAAKDILSNEIANHDVDREYICLVWGHPRERFFKVDAPIARHPYLRTKMAVDVDKGRDAVTHFEVIREFKECSLVKCKLETGRTHQIRVHLSFIGHPIVGDSLYSTKKAQNASEGQLLHAYKLSLTHPKTHQRVTFYAPIDEYFKNNLIYFASR